MKLFHTAYSIQDTEYRIPNTEYRRRGQAALITVLSLGSLILIISISSSLLAYWLNQNIDSNFKALKAYYAAYSGLQDALIKLERNKDYNTPFPLSINGTNDVSVSISGNTITSTATFSQINKKLQTTVVINAATGLITPTSTIESTL